MVNPNQQIPAPWQIPISRSLRHGKSQSADPCSMVNPNQQIPAPWQIQTGRSLLHGKSKSADPCSMVNPNQQIPAPWQIPISKSPNHDKPWSADPKIRIDLSAVLTLKWNHWSMWGTKPHPYYCFFYQLFKPNKRWDTVPPFVLHLVTVSDTIRWVLQSAKQSIVQEIKIPALRMHPCKLQSSPHNDKPKSADPHTIINPNYQTPRP